MNFESGFLSNNRHLSELCVTEEITGLQTIYASKTGFSRILIGRHLGRKIVIKSLKVESANNPVAVTQLNKEFSILFPLVSPYIVHPFRLITIDDHIPAFEMEWCEGSDVRNLLHRPLDPEDALRIIDGVLLGLKDIHLAGIVHRDIKPENVMYDPLRKIVKIIDFGCAYINGGLALQGPNGTIGYTPKEKLNPQSEAEPKDDLYALGVMADEMAESVSTDSRRGSEVKRVLKRFSHHLIDGKYETTENAALAFKALFRKKKINPWVFAGPLIAGSIAIWLFWNLSLPKPDSPSLPSPHTTISDTSTVKPHTPPLSVYDDKNLAVATPLPQLDANIGASVANQPPPIPAPEENRPHTNGAQLAGVWKNPYSGISAKDEATYELACTAGKLLESYHSNHASPQVQMDGFVVTFSDSIYRADIIHTLLPAYADIDELQDKAKSLAAKYKDEMELKFRKRFGFTPDPHRREVLLEGRLFCSLKSYHYNPYRSKGL